MDITKVFLKICPLLRENKCTITSKISKTHTLFFYKIALKVHFKRIKAQKTLLKGTFLIKKNSLSKYSKAVLIDIFKHLNGSLQHTFRKIEVCDQSNLLWSKSDCSNIFLI